ncbi:MAG: hypothetical protein ACKOSS_10710 [Planctomycetia bacterium]
MLALALALGLSPASWAAEDAAEAPAVRLEQARALLASGRAAEAEVALEALLRDEGTGTALPSPLAQAARRELARARLALGRTYAALEPLEALALDGESADLVLYAEALLAHAREQLAGEGVKGTQVAPFLDDARRTLARIPEAQAAALGTHWLAGEVAYLAGDLGGAVTQWDAALALKAADAPRWYLERRAHALYGLGRHAEAAAAYEQVGAERGAAAAWSAARNGERALALYAALLGQHPDDEPLLEEALAAARYAGAEARLEALLAGLASDQPDRRASWALARARLRVALGDRPGALELVTQVAPDASPALKARLCAQEAVLLLGDPAPSEAGRERAAAALLRGLAAQPADATLDGLVSYEVQRDFRVAPNAWPDTRPLDRALRLQRAVAKARPDDPLAHANLANVARLRGELSEALEAFARSLELGGGDPVTRNDSALAWLARGDRAQAESAFRQSVQDDPALLSARQNLARHLCLQGPAGAREARTQLLEAERRARLEPSPSLVYRSLALKAWRTQRRGASQPPR